VIDSGALAFTYAGTATFCRHALRRRQPHRAGTGTLLLLGGHASAFSAPRRISQGTLELTSGRRGRQRHDRVAGQRH